MFLSKATKLVCSSGTSNSTGVRISSRGLLLSLLYILLEITCFFVASCPKTAYQIIPIKGRNTTAKIHATVLIGFLFSEITTTTILATVSRQIVSIISSSVAFICIIKHDIYHHQYLPQY